MKTFLSIDIGTSSTKLSLFDEAGHAVISRSSAYPVDYPHPDWAEQDPVLWWQAVCQLGNEIGQTGLFDRLEGISVSGQTPLCVPIDQRGTPLRKGILWMDRRATGQVAWLKEHIGEDRCRAVSINRLDSYFGGVKWLWYLQAEPELFSQTWKIMQANSYVIYLLTGAAVIDPSQAGLCSPCFNFSTQSWDPGICSEMGIPTGMLPDIKPSHQVIGWITPAASRQTGLPQGLPVVCGGGDFACSCLSTGAASGQQSALMLGTAGNLLYPGVTNNDPRLLHTIHLTGEPLPFGGVMAGGNLNWFANLFNDTTPGFFARLDQEAAAVPAGCEGLLFLPYLMGERTPIWDPQARGAFIGLSTRHTRAHLYRSVLEGIAFAFRQIDRITGRELGSSLDYQIVAIDGGSRSRLWRSILASVIGVPVIEGGERSGTSLGSAFLAALGTGSAGSFHDILQWAETGGTTEPDDQAALQYERLYPLFAGLYEKLIPEFHCLAN